MQTKRVKTLGDKVAAKPFEEGAKSAYEQFFMPPAADHVSPQPASLGPIDYSVKIGVSNSTNV